MQRLREITPPSRYLVVVASLVLAGLPSAAGAQLSISNLLQAQAGNIPFTVPDNRTDTYDQLQLEYLFEGARIGARLEADENSEETFTYRKITQRYAEWSDERVRLRVGNFYTILGRGLLHRSFELPGVVLDKAGLRSSYAPSRDLDGVLAEGSAGPVTALLFNGKPNGGEFTPAVEELGLDRYRGQIAGGQLVVRLPRGAGVGAAYARSTTDGTTQQEAASGFAELDPLALARVGGFALPLYVEYAQLGARFDEWWRFRAGDGSPHALYVASNLLAGPFALSAEWKDYIGFRFGTNDPPSLVREHAWPLLNRSTHVLDAGGEQGYQIEASLAWPGWGSLAANLSRSDAPAAAPDRFEERYLELHLARGAEAPLEATLFYGRGRDGFIGISRREGVGGSATARFHRDYSATADLETQRSRREPADRFRDHYLALTGARAGWGSAAAIWERSTDPAQEEPDEILKPGITPRNFVAGQVTARLSEHHDATLFYGERRGGRACTAGTCYEVLPFKGVELRLMSRF